MDKKVKYWLDTSQYDLDTAKSLLQAKRYLYVGFMCHLAIEKILKGLYVKIEGKRPPYIHNIDRLIRKCGINHLLSDEQKEFIDLIEPLNIEARYPTDKKQLLQVLDYDRCESILQETEELYKWIKELLMSL
jgi:HEPN domain-containing protein